MMITDQGFLFANLDDTHIFQVSVRFARQNHLVLAVCCSIYSTAATCTIQDLRVKQKKYGTVERAYILTGWLYIRYSTRVTETALKQHEGETRKLRAVGTWKRHKLRPVLLFSHSTSDQMWRYIIEYTRFTFL